MEGDDTGRLISPCQCRGSMKYVHASCLDTWRLSSTNQRSFYQCNECKSMYSFRRTCMSHLFHSFACKTLMTVVLMIIGSFLIGAVVSFLAQYEGSGYISYIGYRIVMGSICIGFVGAISLAPVFIERNPMHIRNEAAFSSIILLLGFSHMVYRVWNMVHVITEYLIRKTLDI